MRGVALVSFPPATFQAAPATSEGWVPQLIVTLRGPQTLDFQLVRGRLNKKPWRKGPRPETWFRLIEAASLRRNDPDQVPRVALQRQGSQLITPLAVCLVLALDSGFIRRAGSLGRTGHCRGFAKAVESCSVPTLRCSCAETVQLSSPGTSTKGSWPRKHMSLAACELRCLADYRMGTVAVNLIVDPPGALSGLGFTVLFRP